MSESDDVVGVGMFRKVLDEQRSSERPTAPTTQVYLSNEIELLVELPLATVHERWREALAFGGTLTLTHRDVEEGGEPSEWVVNPRYIVAVCG